MWEETKHKWAPVIAKKLPGFGLNRGRKRIYSVGLPRSGTKSIADLLSPHIRTAHEPLYKETITHLIEWKKGKYTDEEMKQILELRDWRLGLEAESSHFMHYFVSLIKDIFENVKFIMTIREPLGWIESEFGQNMITREMEYWRKLEKFRYNKYKNKYENKKIKESENLYPIKSYLDYWVEHTCRVDKKIEKNKLLKINTYDINKRKKEIEKNCGIKIDKREKVHSNKRDAKKEIYKYVGKEELIKKIKRHECINVIRKRFSILLKDMNYVNNQKE